MSDERRYFQMNDGATYTIVAISHEHAEQILRDSGSEFGQWGRPYDEAKAAGELSWEEMHDEQVWRTHVYIDDGRTRRPLCSMKPGDWFCSEW